METHDDAGAGQLSDGQIPPGLPTPGVSVVWQRSVITGIIKTKYTS